MQRMHFACNIARTPTAGARFYAEINTAASSPCVNVNRTCHKLSKPMFISISRVLNIKRSVGPAVEARGLARNWNNILKGAQLTRFRSIRVLFVGVGLELQSFFGVNLSVVCLFCGVGIDLGNV